MGVPRRGFSGRAANQKRRTRTATRPRELLDSHADGPRRPRRRSCRTTAYRYFPTQGRCCSDALTVDVGDIEELVRRPLEGGDAVERVVDVLQQLNRHVLAEERQYRTTLRFYLDQWLASAAAGEETPILREGRRVRWFSESLAPLRDTIPEAEFDRLVAALSLLCGTEGIAVLRDVCHLDPDDALAVTEWAARALLHATVSPDDR
jgi:hypothetical protein